MPKIFRLILTITFVLQCLIVISRANSVSAVNSSYTYEHIEYLNSTIEVLTNGYLNITEEIKVYAAGVDIVHGIYRDIPTDYWKGPLPYNVDLIVKLIKKDGVNEPYHISKLNNGTRIYIGDSNINLEHGFYTYTIEYVMGPMVGFFNNYDEIYQNITGNGWDWYVFEANGKIILPAIISESDMNIVGYTGLMNEQGKNFTTHVSYIDDKTVIFIQTKTYLKPNEGLTGAVAFPKGIVTPPTILDEVWRLIISSLIFIFPLIGVVFITVYYLVSWIIAGRDPKGKLVYPQFKLPEDISPMLTRIIDRMDFDGKIMVSGFINLAVKGLVKIEETGKNSYKIIKTDKTASNLPGEEQILYDAVKTKSLTVSDTYSKHVYSLYKKVTEDMNERGEKYFTKNFKYLVLPLITIVILGIYSAATGKGEETFGAIFWNAIMIPALVIYYLPSIKRIHKVSFGEVVKILFNSIFFVGFSLIGIVMIFESANSFILLMFVLAIIITGLFQPIMKARNNKGRKVQDDIDGFKMFLRTTEPNKLKVLYPDVPYTIGTFEKFLPFCIAVGLEKLWSEKFGELFASLPEGEANYIPMWYHGHNFTGSSFASSFSSSMSGSIASSSSAPGSSSGSGGFGGGGGGGGGSGGGGGGGGGGGW